MANITKKTTPNANVSQFWNTAVDQNDTPASIAAGDVFRIEESLFRPGKSITINAVGAITIRVNSYYKIAPQRQYNEFNFANYYTNIAQAVETHDTTQTAIPISANGTLTLSNIGPIRNIEIVAMAGAFTLLVT